jgi:hypothetical protein
MILCKNPVDDGYCVPLLSCFIHDLLKMTRLGRSRGGAPYGWGTS